MSKVHKNLRAGIKGGGKVEGGKRVLTKHNTGKREWTASTSQGYIHLNGCGKEDGEGGTKGEKKSESSSR